MSNTPENALPTASDLCAAGWRRFLMTGALRVLLTDHFASGLFQFPTLNNRVWTKLPSSPIMIESVFKWQPTDTDKRPAVLIKAGEWKLNKIAIDNLQYTDKTGNPLYTKVAEGSHVIRCVSKEEGEVETLAAEVGLYLTHFSSVFRSTCNLLRFEVVGMSAPTLVEQHQEQILVDVAIHYGWEVSWQVLQQAPVLKPIKLSAIINPYIHE